MLRRFFGVAVAIMAVTISTSAANRPDADLSGNWLITYHPPGSDINYVIVKIDTQGKKSTATVVATGSKGLSITVKSLRIDNTTVTIELSNTPSFTGTVGKDPNRILGSFGTDALLFRAAMVRTDADTIETLRVATQLPESMSKAQSLSIQPTLLRNQARTEKDADKRKELLAKADEAQTQADEQMPALYREVIAKHANDPVAIDAAMGLLSIAARVKLPVDEARKLVKVIGTGSTPYGARYLRSNMVRVGTTLSAQKGYEAVAVDALKPVVDALADTDAVNTQVNLLMAYKTALEGAGRGDEAKAIEARLAKLETKLDDEYLASVPPFKPTPFSGRKEKTANKVAVMELFTGAQCPPCVAADAAFDALVKAYKPTDLVLIQYHMHIPGPDPMTNPDTVARWNYYRGLFPNDMRGVPSSVFNGKPAAGGGGGMNNAEAKFNQYCRTIDPILEQTTPVKLSGKATRRGDTVQFMIDVGGLEATEDLKLRVLLVEDTVKFVGGNGIRFHHHVVRSMPGSPAGVAIKDKAFTHNGSADVAALRKSLTKYLDDFAANERPFPQPGRPLDMKELSIMALIQNDKTGEIVQALHLHINDKVAATR